MTTARRHVLIAAPIVAALIVGVAACAAARPRHPPPPPAPAPAISRLGQPRRPALTRANARLRPGGAGRRRRGYGFPGYASPAPHLAQGQVRLLVYADEAVAVTCWLAARRVGWLILVDPPVSVPNVVAVYARVSWVDQRWDRDRQVARVSAWVTGQWLTVGRVVTGIGSALNANGGRFIGLLGETLLAAVAAAHRDRSHVFYGSAPGLQAAVPTHRAPVALG